jgi:putative salt-induced outer membrane protein YdiY
VAASEGGNRVEYFGNTLASHGNAQPPQPIQISSLEIITGGIMKIARFFAFIVFAVTLQSVALADTVTMKNGDRLTGTIGESDGSALTIHTDSAGDVKVKWSAIQEVTSEKPIFVVTSDKNIVSGTLTLEGANLVVHTSKESAVVVPLTKITAVRSAEGQQTYEKITHPGLLHDWKGSATVGFALARGNSDTTDLNSGLALNRKTLTDQIKLYESSVYATSSATPTSSVSGVTANAILGGARYDRNITGKMFAFGSADFTHDELQDLTLQSIYTGGLGWHVIARPNTTLDVFAGINYTREMYNASASSIVTSSLTRNLPGITAGEDFTHKFGAISTLTEDFTFYPDLSDISQYRFSLDAAWLTKFNKWLGWQVTAADRYITNPPILGTKSNDLILSTGLNISFGQ